MAQKIDGGSSSSDPSKDNYDATHWSKSERTSDGQTNTYVGKNNDDSGNYCHGWSDSHGNSGVDHRGSCKVCDDEKGSSNDSESGSISIGSFLRGLFDI